MIQQFAPNRPDIILPPLDELLVAIGLAIAFTGIGVRLLVGATKLLGSFRASPPAPSAPPDVAILHRKLEELQLLLQHTYEEVFNVQLLILEVQRHAERRQQEDATTVKPPAKTA